MTIAMEMVLDKILGIAKDGSKPPSIRLAEIEKVILASKGEERVVAPGENFIRNTLSLINTSITASALTVPSQRLGRVKEIVINATADWKISHPGEIRPAIFARVMAMAADAGFPGTERLTKIVEIVAEWNGQHPATQRVAVTRPQAPQHGDEFGDWRGEDDVRDFSE